MKSNISFHGSDLESISSYYNIPKEQILNFAGNVNPLGLSEKLRTTLIDHIDIIASYPDRDYTTLKEALASYCSTKSEYIIVGNGSTELISLLISNRNAKNALLLGPTYSEYERVFQRTGGTLNHFKLEEKHDFKINLPSLLSALTEDYDFFILCNPNNPTSSAISASDLNTIVEHCQQNNIFVMIDETYIEFVSNYNEITAVPLVRIFDNLMIIRGVSKFFAAPGLRFGYGITSNKRFLKHLYEEQNPWSLNSIAALAGETMFTDQDYIDTTKQLIQKERGRFISELSNCSAYKLYPSFANFILVRLEDPKLTSLKVFEVCIKNGLMIRDCSSFFSGNGEYIRFCFLNKEDNQRLIEILKDITT